MNNLSQLNDEHVAILFFHFVLFSTFCNAPVDFRAGRCRTDLNMLISK